MLDHCPHPDILRDYLAGSIDELVAESVSRHAEMCAHCDQRLGELEATPLSIRDQLLAAQLLEEAELSELQRAVAEIPFNDTAAPVPETQPVSHRIGDYRLIRKIGEGGMGTVYQAEHIHLGKQVAVKMLPADRLQSGTAISRFRREMRAVGRLNHPHVVSASDAGEIDGVHFLVMELVEGADLGRIARGEQQLDVGPACEVIRQAALGLAHAHGHGLVHRDVKPSNLILSLDGVVKVLDLGLAGLNASHSDTAATGTGGHALTSVGQLMGTLSYMAPEQITDARNIDARADLYALGATLYRLLAGAAPHDRPGRTASERIDAALSESPIPLSRIRADIPDGLSEFVQKLLSRNPHERLKSATAVAEELATFADGSTLIDLAGKYETSSQAAAVELDNFDEIAIVHTVSVDPGRPSSNRRRKIWSIVVAGILVAGFVIVAVLSYATRDSGQHSWFSGAQIESQRAGTDPDAHLGTAHLGTDPDVLGTDPDALLREGAWLEAVEAAERAVAGNPELGWNHARAAMAWLLARTAGSTDAPAHYERHRRWLASRWQQTGEGANTIPRILCLRSDPPGDLAKMLSAVQRESAGKGRDWRYPHSETVLLYRLGDFHKAHAASDRTGGVVRGRGVQATIVSIWSSMIHEQLGDRDAADVEFRKATTDVSKMAGSKPPRGGNWFDYAECVTVLQEAIELRKLRGGER